MTEAGPDPRDMAEYRAFMETRGRNPAGFQISASATASPEGGLGTSSRTVTVSHASTGASRLYAFRTWVDDFKADLDAGRFDGTG